MRTDQLNTKLNNIMQHLHNQLLPKPSNYMATSPQVKQDKYSCYLDVSLMWTNLEGVEIAYFWDSIMGSRTATSSQKSSSMSYAANIFCSLIICSTWTPCTLSRKLVKQRFKIPSQRYASLSRAKFDALGEREEGKHLYHFHSTWKW